MTRTALGRLEKLDLHDAWQTEAGEFTPWLAKEDNLALLGDVLDMELELLGREQNVGPFRADIVCVDPTRNTRVLVENQLERTDHTHLGQLMTYAAGLEAVAIVWIAERFTDEHRAALDWLNRITDKSVHFFGLEIELWRIGDSAPAPKFNVVAKPNEWTKGPPAPGDLTETQMLYLEYWNALRDHMDSNGSVIRFGKPSAVNPPTFAVGRGGFLLAARVSKQKKMEVLFVIYEPDRLAHFHLLKQQQAEIEKELGTGIEWRELPEGKESHIKLARPDSDPEKPNDWPRQHEWLRTTLEAFHGAFAERVKRLDGNDWDGGDGASE